MCVAKLFLLKREILLLASYALTLCWYRLRNVDVVASVSLGCMVDVWLSLSDAHDPLSFLPRRR